MRIEQSVVINRPVEEVFALLADFEKLPLWDAAVVEAMKTSEGPMGVGATIREVVRMLGRRVEMTGEVTEYEPNRKITFRTTSGPLPGKVTEAFEAAGGGARVTFATEIELGGVFKLAEPIVARMFKAQVKGSAASLKDFLETRA